MGVYILERTTLSIVGVILTTFSPDAGTKQQACDLCAYSLTCLALVDVARGDGDGCSTHLDIKGLSRDQGRSRLPTRFLQLVQVATTRLVFFEGHLCFL